MSNALAIASVTAILKDVLNDGLINRNLDALFSFQVTAQPPDRLSAGANGGDFNRLNLFLYRVSPNTGWVNQRLPSRSSAGDRIDNPFLALDLHYMLSAFATEDLNAEILLGYGMQVLHETPVLGRDAIRTALGAGGPVTGSILPAAFQALNPTDLADQVEQIKITPYYVGLDEISKLWMAMNTPLRMTALYQVSVVLIESQTAARSALPVLNRALFVRQMQLPRIQRILSRAPADPDFSATRPIVHGDELRLEGSNLRGDVTIVAIGELEIPPTEATPAFVRVNVPSGLHAGVTGIAIILRIPKLPPSTEFLPGETSNLSVFILHPSFAAVNPITLNGPALEDNTDPAGPVRGSIRVNFAHNVGSRQRVEILLNELNPPASRPARMFTFGADPVPGTPPPAETTQRDFTIRQVDQGTYMVRVRVDAAESAMEVTGGVFSGPTIDILP